MEPPKTVTTFMEDGCVSVTVGHLTGVVSSAHLVEPKENQLRQRWLQENAIMTIDPQDALASLRQWQLEQDNSGRFRVYRDQHGQIYHSVTHILKNTAPQSQKDALERWSQRAGSGLERDLACDRGTVAHEHCEYVLKTAAKLARQSANKKGSWKVWDDGLARPPKAVTNWALKKAEEGSPKVPWPAREYARGLSDWLVSGSVTAIHASRVQRQQ